MLAANVPSRELTWSLKKAILKTCFSKRWDIVSSLKRRAAKISDISKQKTTELMHNFNLSQKFKRFTRWNVSTYLKNMSQIRSFPQFSGWTLKIPGSSKCVKFVPKITHKINQKADILHIWKIQVFPNLKPPPSSPLFSGFFFFPPREPPKKIGLPQCATKVMFSQPTCTNGESCAFEISWKKSPFFQ